MKRKSYQFQTFLVAILALTLVHCGSGFSGAQRTQSTTQSTSSLPSTPPSTTAPPVAIPPTTTPPPTVTPPAQPPSPSTSDNLNWLKNNSTVSTNSPIGAAGDEQEVLFSGRKTLNKNFFWVTPFYNPYESFRSLPPDNGLYGGVQWHGGWGCGNSGTNSACVVLPEFGNYAWFRGTTGTMLQFMLKNLNSNGPYTDADYFFEDFDKMIDTYGSVGKKVSFHWYVNIRGKPTFSFGDNNFRINVPSVSIARFKDALQRIARRKTKNGIAAADVIGLWEGPNEPNSAHGGTWNWNDQIGDMKMAEMVEQYRIVSQCVKEVLPAAQIMGASFSAIDSYMADAIHSFLTTSAAGRDSGCGSNRTGAGTFGRDWVDVVSMHGYYSNDQHRTADVAAAHRHVKNKIAQAGAAGKPYVISEWMGFEGVWDSGMEESWRIDQNRELILYFNHMAMAVANEAQIHVHFTYKAESAFGNISLPGVLERRKWRDDLVKWITTGEIARIVRFNNTKIRITKTDGTSRETP